MQSQTCSLMLPTKLLKYGYNLNYYLLIMVMPALIPFVLIQCACGKKTYSLIAIIYIVFISYLWFEIANAKNDSGGGPGLILGLVIAYSFCYGAFAGIITKGVTFYMAKCGVSLGKRTFVRAFGVFLIPAYIYTLYLYDKWEKRPPNSSCNYDIVNFQIDDQVFRLPALRIISANRGNGKFPENADDSFFFHENKGIRKYCSASNNGKSFLKVNAFDIALYEIARERNKTRFSNLCQQALWPDDICHYEGRYSPDGYPKSIRVYDNTLFNAGYTGDGWRYNRIEGINKAKEKSDIPNFSFDGHYYYWLDDKESLAVRCYKLTPKLYCQTDEILSENIYITYGAKVSIENPIQDFEKIRQKTREFIKDIKTN